MLSTHKLYQRIIPSGIDLNESSMWDKDKEENVKGNFNCLSIPKNRFVLDRPYYQFDMIIIESKCIENGDHFPRRPTSYITLLLGDGLAIHRIAFLFFINGEKIHVSLHFEPCVHIVDEKFHLYRLALSSSLWTNCIVHSLSPAAFMNWTCTLPCLSLVWLIYTKKT